MSLNYDTSDFKALAIRRREDRRARVALHAHLAMTCEVTLSGLVLPIGGVKEKVLPPVAPACTT